MFLPFPEQSHPCNPRPILPGNPNPCHSMEKCLPHTASHGVSRSQLQSTRVIKGVHCNISNPMVFKIRKGIKKWSLRKPQPFTKDAISDRDNSNKSSSAQPITHSLNPSQPKLMFQVSSPSSLYTVSPTHGGPMLHRPSPSSRLWVADTLLTERDSWLNARSLGNLRTVHADARRPSPPSHWAATRVPLRLGILPLT